MLTERGRTTTFAASRRIQRERGDDLPLICTEVRVRVRVRVRVGVKLPPEATKQREA